MTGNLNEPNDRIKEELTAAIHARYKTHFEDWNVHPIPMSIVAYRMDKGEWIAEVNLNWQSKPDFKFGTNVALFRYGLVRQPPNGHERRWYGYSDMND
ncbi:hypothetical protein [Burkholderia sp. BCC0322]|uniref:hypothetical protein n=1 Tax=unclassified Burkholderia TaxID=2613784 RepID=UPI00158F368C|nr:hypothetical protein [Burkholderia sp. BCC0322]